MLTGETSHRPTDRQAAGIERVLSDVRPDEKRPRRRLQAEREGVAIVGDGINDAPALAAGRHGLAMGIGTDVAMNRPSVTLMTGDLRALATAVELSPATMRNIRQNLFWAFPYNVLDSVAARRPLSHHRDAARPHPGGRRNGQFIGHLRHQRAPFVLI